jgi:diadenylate cyclase
MIEDFLYLFKDFRVSDAIDILVVAFIFYHTMKFIREAHATRIVLGFVGLFLAGALAGQFHLITFHWLLSNLWPILILSFVVIFQPDLRRVLNRITFGNFLRNVFDGDAVLIKEISQAAKDLAKNRLGALIVIERSDSLQMVIETGTKIDSEVSSEMLVTLFLHHAPMHDGAAIIRNGRITAAGCILPLSQNPNLEKKYGTRHRAAIGITEDTDALAIVVSEESRTISFSMSGKITQHINADVLEEMLTLYGTRVG